MCILSKLVKIMLPISLLILANCQMTDIAQNPLNALRNSAASNYLSADGADTKNSNKNYDSILSLKDVTAQATPKVNVDAGFAKAVAAAVRNDPQVHMARKDVLLQQARLGVTKSQLDFQFSGTVYAGVEDVTDKTNGIAAVLNATKVMYDGGQISSTVSADEYAVQSALEGYKASLDERALEMSVAWVELERYQSLNLLISNRLAVLNPLIKQLERIADAGVGDATQVVAAQRTVSMIKVTQTDVEERLTQAELNFIRFFGKLPEKANFNSVAVAAAIPDQITRDMVMSAPSMLSIYAAYLRTLESVEVAKAGNNLTVGFETKVQRPFGDSGYDSDESVGFVVRKVLFNGDTLPFEIKAAQASADRQEAKVREVYRRIREEVETAMQSISSAEKAIIMSRSNSRALTDEISLLRKQLVIGQSTLDSVLSAEARLYDVESKEIHSAADKKVSQLVVLSAIGRLSPLIGLQPEDMLD